MAIDSHTNVQVIVDMTVATHLRAQGASLFLMELLCECGTIEGSLAQAQELVRKIRDGHFDELWDQNERLGMLEYLPHGSACTSSSAPNAQ